MADFTRTTSITAEDLPYLAPEEGFCELVAGEIVCEPWTGEELGWVAGSILGLAGRFILDHRLGRVYTRSGFVLARNPDTVRAPDAAFVSAQRLATATRRGPYFEGAPDLAVEVLSPGNAPASMVAKVRDFLAAGARAVWVADPTRQEVTVHRPGRPPETLSLHDTLDCGSAVPGFRLPVREIFEG